MSGDEEDAPAPAEGRSALYRPPAALRSDDPRVVAAVAFCRTRTLLYVAHTLAALMAENRALRAELAGKAREGQVLELGSTVGVPAEDRRGES